MAKVTNNIVIHGLSGMLGKQVVVRRQKNGQYVVCAAPHHGPRAASAAERAHQQRFRQAVLYAKGAKDAPEYQEAAKVRGLSGFNVAVADFLHPPEIQDIDLSAYSGAAGGSIGIVAVDDASVKSVGVSIVTDDGSVVEQGAAVRSSDNPNLWHYTATATAPAASLKIVANVSDLAGQIAERTQHT